MHYQSADSCWSSSYNNSTTTSTMSSSSVIDGHVNQPATASSYSINTNIERLIERLASENAVVIFSISSCCMCHAIKRLFCGMGVNPTVYELDQDPNKGKDIEKALMNLLLFEQQQQQQQQQGGSTSSSSSSVPVVFIGGKLVGPMDRVMASHINGSLVPLLKSAGALWL